MAENPIQLVCFDIGGVLIRICHTWSDACREACFDLRGEAASAHAALAIREIMGRYGRGEISEDEWMYGVGTALGSLYTRDELMAIHNAVIMDEYADVESVVDDLHRAGLATACLSNTDPVHWTRLIHHDGHRPLPGRPKYPALHRLGSHHASHLMGLAKPDRAIYRAFERTTGVVGRHILFFDDRRENVDAARDVGWRAEEIDPLTETAPQLRRYLRAYGIL
jgi:glucose-1-phosphatase